jgi:hypothetical protein
LRAQLKGRTGWRCWGLVQRCVYGESVAHPAEKSLTRADLLCRVRLGRKWTLDMRGQFQEVDRRLRSQRYPWAPATEENLSHLFRGRIRFEGTQGSWRLKAGVVVLHRERAREGGLRTLVSATVIRRGRLGWRVGHALAWGRPVDLVSVINPVPGLVMPRHWGNWLGETHAGLGLRSRSWEFWGACSWRQPVEATGQDRIQVWLALSRRS